MRCALRVFLVLLACAAVQGHASQASPSPGEAGVVVLAEGDARLAPKGGEAQPTRVGEIVHEGDLLVTGKDGELHVKLQDSGFLVLRPNTRFQVVAYVADGGDGDKGIFRLIAGGVRSITGWIGKFNARSYQVQTATATIGIRGTDHETRVVPEGSAEGEAGTYDRVYEGETYIESAAGKVAVTRNRAGFLANRPRERARLLASIPVFYKPGPHEDEIAKKHAEIQREIVERRKERQKAVAEKRAELAASRAKTKEMLKDAKPATRAERRDLREFKAEQRAAREALGRDMRAATELQGEIVRERKALEDDFKAGRTPRAQMLERRNELQAKEARLKAMQDDITAKRKALEEATDAKVDQRLEATGASDAVKQQVQDTREKRKALEDEKASAQQEIKSLQQEEGKRYREELKADRKGAEPGAPQK